MVLITPVPGHCLLFTFSSQPSVANRLTGSER